MTDLTEFTLFNRLPPETRRLIWYHALPGPRIHLISRRSPSLPARSSCPPPPILFVCRESYSEALRVLKPLHLPSHGVTPCTFNPDTKTYCCVPVLINPEIDTIYLPGRAQFPLGYRDWFCRNADDFGLVRSLAVDLGWSRTWRTGFDERIGVEEIVRCLGHVETLHLVSEYSLFNPNVKYDYSTWGKIGTGEGWQWMEPKDKDLWENVSNARRWQESMRTQLEMEKKGYSDIDGETPWVVPEVVLSFVRFEALPLPKVFREEEQILGGLELVKVAANNGSGSLWSKVNRFVMDRLGIQGRLRGGREKTVCISW
jgi:2EXR family